MPSPDTYQHVFYLGTTAPSASTTIQSGFLHFPTNVIDDRDGTTDDSTAANNLLSVDFNPGVPFTFHGFGLGQDPVVSFFNGTDTQYYLLSDIEHSNGINISFSAGGTYQYCFAEGTGIATAKGEVAVEALEIGDRVLTHEGDEAVVKWVGRQTISTKFGPADRLLPVRFAAGSLGTGQPHRDLTVTADHALLLDGVLCCAGALVNGTTINRVPMAEMGQTFTVYHVETENHAIILANGVAAETFIDTAGRHAFDNFAEYEALYGADAAVEEMPLPRVTQARQLPATIRNRLKTTKVA